MQVRLAETLRYELQVTFFQCLDRRFCHLFHLNEPLRLDHRLYRRLAAVVCADVVLMRYDFYEKSEVFQVFYHGLSCLITIHTCIFSAKLVDRRIIVHDVDLRQIVTLSYLKVVRVMCRCNLHAARSELLIYVCIRNNRNFTVGERQLQHFSDQMLISLIIRVDCHRGIAKQRLRTCRCDLHKFPFFSNDRIIDVPEESVLIHMLYLSIRNRCLADRTPVDDAGTFVDIAFFIKADKYLLYCLGAALIHRETFSVPVSRCTELFQLINDLSAVLFLPCPCML